MPETNLTPGEVSDSLTGFEEQWIAEQFGKPIGELTLEYLTRNNPGPLYRSLIFILKRREDVNEDDARNQVMGMRLDDVLQFFPQEKDSTGEDKPADDPDVKAVEESEKDEAASEPQPLTSLTSVS